MAQNPQISPKEKQVACTVVVRLYTDGMALSKACKEAGITIHKFNSWLPNFKGLKSRYDVYKNRVGGKKATQKRVFPPAVKEEICRQIIEAYPLSGKGIRALTAEYNINPRKFYEWIDSLGLKAQWALAQRMGSHVDSQDADRVEDVKQMERVSEESRLRCLAALSFWVDYFAEAVLKWDVPVEDANRYFTKKRAFDAAGITPDIFYRAYRSDDTVKDQWDKAKQQRAELIAMVKAEMIDEMRYTALKSLRILGQGMTVKESRSSTKRKPIKMRYWDADADDGKGAMVEEIQYVEETSFSENDRIFLPDFSAVKLILEMGGDYTPRQDQNVQLQGEVVLGIMGRKEKEELQGDISDELQALRAQKKAIKSVQEGDDSGIFITDADYQDVDDPLNSLSLPQSNPEPGDLFDIETEDSDYYEGGDEA